MLTRDFSKLPAPMQNSEVRGYYDMLSRKRAVLFAKRFGDILVSLLLIVILSPLFLILAVAIKIDSKGPVFYRQQRVTKNLRLFRIFKFRTMVVDADKQGPLVTIDGDSRITRVGSFLRNARLDELPQVFNVFVGDMSFVGTRPEVERYVAHYTNDMYATLLLPAGVTSQASIYFKDEAEMLGAAQDADAVYINEILPRKMRYNLEYLKTLSLWGDIKTLFSTVFAVIPKNQGS